MEKPKPPPQSLLEPKLILEKCLVWKNLTQFNYELINVPNINLLYYTPAIILDARGRGVNKTEKIWLSCSLCSSGGDKQKTSKHKYFQIVIRTKKKLK